MLMVSIAKKGTAPLHPWKYNVVFDLMDEISHVFEADAFMKVG